MAERRMFSKTIIDSDIFLDMPQTAQNLYFHLGMRADDEGFINSPKKIMRIIGANQNDMELLLAKRYLLSFDSGVVVVKHWCMHNAIRKDRIKETVYIEEKNNIKLKDNGSYTEIIPISSDVAASSNQVSTKRQPNVSIGEVRLGEVSVVKDSKDTVRENSFEEFWELYNNKKKKVQTKKLFMALSDTDFVEMRKNVKLYVESTHTDGQFPSRMHPTTYLNATNKLWRDEIKPITNGKTKSLVNGGYGTWK